MADSAETLALRVMLEDLASAGIRNMNSSLHTLEGTVSQLGGVAQGTGTRLQGLGTNASAASGHVRSLGTSSQTANRNVREFGASAAAARGHTAALGSASQAASLAIREQGVATRQSTTATRLATQAVRSLGRGSREAAAGVRAHGTASRTAASQVRAMGTEARKTVADLRAMGTASRSSATDLERAAAQMIASLGAITRASDMAAANMARTFSRSSMNAARTGGRNAGSAWSEGFAGSIRANQSKLLAPLKGSASMLGLAGMVGVGALGGMGINRLSTIEGAEMAFKTQLGTQRMAKEYSAELLAFAKTTPFAFQDIANQARNLMAFGLPQQDVIPTLQAVGDSAAAGGTGTPGMVAIGTALGKIMSQGQIYADDINSLAVNGVQARQFLANAYDVDGPGLRKMMMGGQINGEDAVRIIRDGIEKGSEGRMGKFAPLAGLMDDMKKTWAGGMSDFKAQVTSSMANIMSGAMPGINKGIDWVQERFRTLPAGIENLKSYAAAPLQAIGTGFGAIASAGGGVVSMFNEMDPAVKSVLIGLAAYMVAGRGVARSLTQMSAAARQNWAFASYGQGRLSGLRAGLTQTRTALVGFRTAFTDAGRSYSRALAGPGGQLLNNQAATLAALGRSWSSLGNVASRTIRTMTVSAGRGLLGAVGGGWGLAIMAGVTALSLWINKQGEAARAAKEHAAAVAQLASTMHLVTGAVTGDTRQTTAAAWANDGQFAKLDAMGVSGEVAFNGVLNGGAALNGTNALLVSKTAESLRQSEAWKKYGDALKAQNIDAELIVRSYQYDSANLEEMLSGKLPAGTGGTGGKGQFDGAAEALYEQAKVAYDGNKWAFELVNKSREDVVKASQNRAQAFQAATKSAADMAGIDADEFTKQLTMSKNAKRSLNDVLTDMGVTDPNQQMSFLEQMSGLIVKSGDDMYYLDQKAADAAQKLKDTSLAMTDVDDAAEQIGDRNFMRDWGTNISKSTDEINTFADDAKKALLSGWSERAESPYVQMLAEIGDSADDAAGRVEAFRATLDKALGIDRASEQVDADYFAGLQSLKEGFKTITEDSGGMIENYMGKKGDWNVQGVTSEGKMPGIEGRKNDEAFMKLIDARILDAYDKAMAAGAGEGAARAAAVAAGNQGKQDYLSAAATQSVDPGLANAAFNRNYGGETVDQKVNLILEEASVARFEAGIGAAISSAGEDYSSQMSAAVEYVADYAQSHGMEIPADLDTLPALSAYNGLRAKVETELQMRINAMAQLTIQYNYANRATGVRGLEKESANGNIFGFADGGERHSMMVAGGANGRGILWGEPETGWESYISGKPSQRTRNIGLMKQTASRLGGRFIANNETNAASVGGVIAPAATTGSGSGGGLGGGAMTIAANAVQVRIDGGTHSGEQIGAIVTEAVAKAMYEVQRENESRKF